MTSKLEENERNSTNMDTSMAKHLFFFNSEKWKWIMEILFTITQSTMKAEVSLETIATVSEIRD